MKYHPALCGVLTTIGQTPSGTVAGGQFDWGGRLRKRNGGARRWAQRGRYSRLQSVTAEARLTVRPTGRAATKVGRSDPVVPRGRAIAQRIKGTLGITGLSRPRVHIDGAVWHLDVGLSHPGAGEGPKGPAVRRLKWYMSWVQNVVRQFGLYPSWAVEHCGARTLVREDRVGRSARVPAVVPTAPPGSDDRHR